MKKVAQNEVNFEDLYYQELERRNGIIKKAKVLAFILTAFCAILKNPLDVDKWLPIIILIILSNTILS